MIDALYWLMPRMLVKNTPNSMYGCLQYNAVMRCGKIVIAPQALFKAKAQQTFKLDRPIYAKKKSQTYRYEPAVSEQVLMDGKKM